MIKRILLLVPVLFLFTGCIGEKVAKIENIYTTKYVTKKIPVELIKNDTVPHPPYKSIYMGTPNLDSVASIIKEMDKREGMLIKHINELYNYIGKDKIRDKQLIKWINESNEKLEELNKGN